jgi:uncharacterized protein YukE
VPAASGKEIYDALAEIYQGPPGASESLGAAGIPGLRYLDGISRSDGEGTRNYVIWDEALLTPEKADIKPYYSRAERRDDGDTEIRALVEQYANVNGAPTEAQIRAAVKQYREAEKAYGGKVAYDKAKADGRTKLTYGQWVQVRTPNFKRWFGDWAGAKARAALEAINAVRVKVPATWAGADVKTLRDLAKTAYQQAAGKGAVMMKDGREVKLTQVGFKETRQHSADRRVMELMASIREVLESAVPLASRAHTLANAGDSVRAWHYYGAKVTLGGKEQYAKIAVRESVNGEIYYDADLTSVESLGGRIGDATPTKSGAATVSADDFNISQWWNGINPDEVSKVTDSETGEPMVVYHGTNHSFDVFDPKRRTPGFLGRAFYLSGSSDLAGAYAKRDHRGNLRDGSNVMAAFVDAKSLHFVDLSSMSHTEFQSFPDRFGGDDGLSAWLSANGNDAIVGQRDPNIAGDGAEFWEVAVQSSNQIKSATGNIGTFGESDDIRFSRKADAQMSEQPEKADIKSYYSRAERRDDGDAEIRALVEQYANVNGAPTEAQIAEAVKQYREAEKAYGGKPAYDKAKADGRTKLTYGQWVQVRTPNFKRWFGDWAGAKARAALEAINAVRVKVPATWAGADVKTLRDLAKTAYQQAAVTCWPIFGRIES